MQWLLRTIIKYISKNYNDCNDCNNCNNSIVSIASTSTFNFCVTDSNALLLAMLSHLKTIAWIKKYDPSKVGFLQPQSKYWGWSRQMFCPPSLALTFLIFHKACGARGTLWDPQLFMSLQTIV